MIGKDGILIYGLNSYYFIILCFVELWVWGNVL